MDLESGCNLAGCLWFKASDEVAVMLSAGLNWDIKETSYLYTMEEHSDLRKDKTLPFGTTWMDPENIMISKISRKQSRTI